MASSEHNYDTPPKAIRVYWRLAKGKVNFALHWVWTKAQFWEISLLISLVFCLWWYFHIPPPGYAVTSMAVFASVMALRSEMRHREKFLWFIVSISFALVELKAIDTDKKEYAATVVIERDAQNKRFKGIADGISNSIIQNQKHFETTMKALDENIKTITGGNSFCYITFVGIGGGKNALMVFQMGRFPLHGVQARFYDLDKGRDLYTVDFERIPVGQGLLRQDIVLDEKAQGLRVNIFFHALNGTWLQALRMRKIGGEWYHAIRVQSDRGKVLYEHVQPNFGRIDWKKD